MKTIINDTESFSATVVVVKVKGTANIIVNDNGTDTFPFTVDVHTNKGNKRVNKDISGNCTIEEKISIAKVVATISDWQCSAEKLHFHLNIKAAGKTLYDKTLEGAR